MNTPLLFGALVVSILLLLGLLNIVKTTFKTAFLIAIVVFGLQMFTGIGPEQVWKQILQFIAGMGNWFRQSGGKYKPPEGFRETQLVLWSVRLLFFP